jgi:hypothetical protein
MEPSAMTAFLAQPSARTQARSALPDAPVVPHMARVSINGRVRTAIRRVAGPVSGYVASLRRGNGTASWDESPCRPSPTVSA